MIGEEFVGMNRVILPDVSLGDYTIVGAVLVVTHSFPQEYAIIARNSAKIKRLFVELGRKILEMSNV